MRGDEPAIYIGIFLILFIIAIVMLTLCLYYYNQAQQCAIEPNIWCWNTWQCEGGGGGNCSAVTGPTGLAECLFGPTGTIAGYCFNAPQGPTSDPLCDCVINGASNCLNGCYSNLADAIQNGAICPSCTGTACEPTQVN